MSLLANRNYMLKLVWQLQIEEVQQMRLILYFAECPSLTMQSLDVPTSVHSMPKMPDGTTPPNQPLSTSRISIAI